MTNLPLPPPSLPLPPLNSFARKAKEVSLTEMLLSTTSAATTRNQEATLMFQHIASVLDDAIDNNNSIPNHLQKPFRDFVTDLSCIARRHFECHIRGSPRPPAPYSSVPNSHPKNVAQATLAATPATASSRQPKSFAAVTAASAPPHGPQKQSPTNKSPAAPGNSKTNGRSGIKKAP